MKGMRSLPILALMASVLAAQPPAQYESMFLRLAEEAEAFAQLSTKMVGQEKLEQVAAQTPPRFQQRGVMAQTAYTRRQIVSEYAFSMFKDDPGNLHELRQVLSIDGRKVTAPGKLRETLTMNRTGESDKAKRRLLKEFESYGLREAATDFGQLIMLFAKRAQSNYRFVLRRTENIGAERVAVFSFIQLRAGSPAMTVFNGKNVNRHPLAGEVSLRIPDGLPLRITLDATERIKDVPLRRAAIVEYQQNAQGLMLPASVIYAESVNGRMLVENRFQYSDFRMFGASSDVKFSAEEPLQK